METKPLTDLVPPRLWLPELNSPLLIAGPCSAESPEQLFKVANELKQSGRVHYLRAGIWKPRTTPGSFQGVGLEGLGWLRDVKKGTGLPFSTEVGSEKHVYEALKFGVDMVWIGARTVSNPFVMQEIAEALRGVNIPVLVKNPLSPDMDLWEGAIKRLYNVGIRKIGAIHRGFSWWGKSIFRNQPFWKIPLDLKAKYPDLPIICDPSHISGNRNLVPFVAKRGVDMGFDGLIIEVHPEPTKALSDAAQQLTPSEFYELLNFIDSIGNPELSYPDDLLNELRAEVDIMDDLLLWALSNRMELSERIASVKTNRKMSVLQSKRWGQVLERVTNTGEKSGLRAGFIKKLYNTIHKESISVQNELIEKS
ncbi:MAG: bifunctional 3-deoxy-7-phosphoheptulonate synthase/chorismate mutase type II [Bacteroidales bacterium]|nr:bifunctional 3-deoxy-7-phosphoheptulonate synthase/chorismate mutase type II [Bacteroidales bacterium]